MKDGRIIDYYYLLGGRMFVWFLGFLEFKNIYFFCLF